MPLEKTIVARVMSQCRTMGFWVQKTHGSSYSMSGMPDVLAIRGGVAHWMEVKQPGQKPTRIQEHRMRQLAEAGCPVAVVHSAGEARAFLEASTYGRH